MRLALRARGAPPARPSTAASSRKKSATRSSPAPTHTTSPVAQSWSSCSGPVAGDAPRQHLALPERRPGARAPGAGRAPREASRAGRSRASSAGSGRASPARPARPPCAARRATRGAAGGGRRGRTTRARVPPGRSSPRTSLLLALERAELGLDVAAEVLVRLAGRERAARRARTRATSERSGSSPLSRKPRAARTAASRRVRRDSGRRPRRRSGARRRQCERMPLGALEQRICKVCCRIHRFANLLDVEADRANRSGVRGSPRNWRSTSSSAPGSIRSRSSSWPSSSRSRSRSSESACARRSAGGVSSSYMYVAT